VVRRTEIPFSIDDRKILLVDDVLYTGRTTRARARRADRLRPAQGDSADRARGPRPPRAAIKADYVGKNLPTALDESVQVRLQEIDERDEVVLEQGGAA
jgi:pyrimidine operon attenuation protein/uracil phosphoribosyltransferase